MRKTPILAALLGLGLFFGALASPAQAQMFGRRYYYPSYYARSYYAPSYYGSSYYATPYGASTYSYYPNMGASSYYYTNPGYYSNSYYYNYRRPVLGRRAYRYRHGWGYGY